MKLARWLSVALVSAFLLHGCSCLIPVSVSGSLEGGIVFKLDERRDVDYAGIRMLVDGSRWEEVWRVEGDGSVAAITYGERPRGLRQAISPQTLQKNRLYSFTVEEPSVWVPCVGSVYFFVNDEGSVEECQTEQCRQRFR